ncbi:MAG: HNH endonuclease [Coriobacteriia bacterium]|nr:HNH endonuclease [Coriobacteriia bacterium]
MESPLQLVLDQLDPEHARALLWFAEHEGDIGPRPWRVDGQSVVTGVQVPLVAQRGIHQPSGWQVALSITATRASVYFDGVPQPIDSDTWALPYMAHTGRDGTGTESPWNRALLGNLNRRIPVGVFVPHGAHYMNLGLAMVESYDPRTGTFLLRGPLKFGQRSDVWSNGDDETPTTQAAMARESEGWSDQIRELDEPIVYSRGKRRVAQVQFRQNLLRAYDNRCAVTGYEAHDALQGAHILSYRGRSSQLVRNGLLLRADIHLLFDRHLIGIEPEVLKVRLAPGLLSTAYSGLEGRSLSRPQRDDDAPDTKRLAVHWAVFERSF